MIPVDSADAKELREHGAQDDAPGPFGRPDWRGKEIVVADVTRAILEAGHVQTQAEADELLAALATDLDTASPRRLLTTPGLKRARELLAEQHVTKARDDARGGRLARLRRHVDDDPLGAAARQEAAAGLPKSDRSNDLLVLQNAAQLLADADWRAEHGSSAHSAA